MVSGISLTGVLCQVPRWVVGKHRGGGLSHNTIGECSPRSLCRLLLFLLLLIMWLFCLCYLWLIAGAGPCGFRRAKGYCTLSLCLSEKVPPEKAAAPDPGGRYKRRPSRADPSNLRPSSLACLATFEVRITSSLTPSPRRSWKHMLALAFFGWVRLRQRTSRHDVVMICGFSSLHHSPPPLLRPVFAAEGFVLSSCLRSTPVRATQTDPNIRATVTLEFTVFHWKQLMCKESIAPSVVLHPVSTHVF